MVIALLVEFDDFPKLHLGMGNCKSSGHRIVGLYQLCPMFFVAIALHYTFSYMPNMQDKD